MELTTRSGGYASFIEIKVDEVKTDIWKNGNESDEFIQNLLSVIEDVCNLREESVFEYLEKHYEIKITKNEEN